jgi:hypothetical protein
VAIKKIKRIINKKKEIKKTKTSPILGEKEFTMLIGLEQWLLHWSSLFIAWSTLLMLPV